jgi:intein/homing endonuclease
MTPSTRAQIITRRTYNRPKNEEGTEFESWEETVDRVISHQRWLWCRALTHKLMPEMPLHDISENLKEWVVLNKEQEKELSDLKELILERKVTVSGRNLWLGGTGIGRSIEASQFNCAALNIETVYDVVDAFWLLLNGAGVGFRPVAGTLTGFPHQIAELEVIRSKGSKRKGREHNTEYWDPDTRTWTISVGDSAISWAKFIGKLLAGKHKANKLILDFSEIRAAGLRLKNYGWISTGDIGLASASQSIFKILNDKADSLLTAIDILDITNLLGTILSTRRSAQIAIYDYEDPEWVQFSEAKNGIFENGKSHRSQSNNSIYFKRRPEKEVLAKLFDQINRGGGGEPGIINGQTMRARSPWASLTNPCITKDTLITTDLGVREVKDLINVPFRARLEDNDYSSRKGFFSTGVKDIYRVQTNTGLYLKITANHKVWTKERGWVEVQNLRLGENLVSYARKCNSDSLHSGEFDMGWLVGKVFASEPTHFHNVDTYIDTDAWTIKPAVFKESESFIKGFLGGIFDTLGVVLRKISLSDLPVTTLETIQQLLLAVGIQSAILEQTKELSISGINYIKFGSTIGFKDLDKHEVFVSVANTKMDHSYTDTNYTKITDIIYAGKEEVFDCTVDEVHQFVANGLIIHNCGEILLPSSGGFCCLTSINLSAFKDNLLETLRAAALITRANYRQTVVDFRDGILQEKWHLNNDHLHLCGVSIMGVAESNLSPYDYTRLERAITTAGYTMAEELDKAYPKQLTTIKPEGCETPRSMLLTNIGLKSYEELLKYCDVEDTNGWLNLKEDIIALGSNNKITKLYNNGTKQVIKFKTTYGFERTCTTNHPWYVDNIGWVETGNLCIGDKLVLDYSSKLGNTEVSLATGQLLSTDLAWLLGVYYAKGNVLNKDFSISHSNTHLIDKVANIIENELGTEAKGTSSTVYSQISDFMGDNDLLKYSEYGDLRPIPELVRESKHTILAFLAGLADAVGHITKEGTLVIGPLKTEVAISMQDAALACGIVLSRKNGTLSSTHVFNNLEEFTTNLVSNFQITLSSEPSDFVVEYLEQLGEASTYGIEVEESHWYLASGGIKSHNTISKCYDSTEGMHKPLGKYIFNNVAFSKYDPLVEKLRSCNYKVFPHPYDPNAFLATLPVKYDNVEFEIVDGKEVNLDSAITQLNEYKMLMQHYCHQNVSCTISYSIDETDDIVDWLYNNWDNYVAVSFLFRNDPTKTASDLGYPYLPQEVVTKEQYEEYVSKLKEFNLNEVNSSEELLEDGCAGGVCPVR